MKTILISNISEKDEVLNSLLDEMTEKTYFEISKSNIPFVIKYEEEMIWLAVKNIDYTSVENCYFKSLNEFKDWFI